MRFMFIVKSAHSGPPTPKLIEAMHKLADREIKAGRMLDSGGLTPLAMGAQVRIANDSYFLRYFSSTSTEQISPIPRDLS